MKGNIFKKGNRYYIRYDLGKDSDGKRIQKVESGFDTKRQAEKVLRERITELEGSFSKKVERCTVAVYLQDWLTSYCQPRLARNTIAGYRVNIEKHIVPHIGSIKWPPCQDTNFKSEVTLNVSAGNFRSWNGA